MEMDSSIVVCQSTARNVTTSCSRIDTSLNNFYKPSRAMSSVLNILGLKPNAFNPSVEPPNLAPYHTIWNFLFAYVILSARYAKMRLNLDHNTNPRLDLAKYGQRAVAEGKITKAQLDFLHRNESCHANSMEHFPVFAAAIIFATVAGVSVVKINAACAVYTAARIAFAFVYLATDKLGLTYIRSLAWWTSNFACIYLYWIAGKALNAGKW